MNYTFNKELVCIGEQIRKLRKKKKMSQEELACRIGVSVITVSRIESGMTTMNIQTLMNLSEILDVPVDEILYRRSDEEMHRDTASG
ncbi:MAG: helix-turn-helix transcriptional regulator [Blautia sp.]|nr:helix-turn-helix transcriptional regulator [Blautia sp.]